RLADVGVAMGRSGTDVTKEAADMVLADDNFATIVTAVEEGRRIYDNIRRFVRYLLTTNSAEVGLMFLAPLIGMPIPLLPVQILWINLVTDGPPAIALGLEPAEPDVLRRPPRPPEQSIVSGGLWLHALVTGAAMAAVTVAVQVAARAAHWRWQTMVFTLLVFLQLANALANRSKRAVRRSSFQPRNPWVAVAVAGVVGAQLALVYVGPLHGVLDTESLRPQEMAIVLGASVVGVTAPKTATRVLHRLTRRND
ncbi:MAG TPA: cation transporting ATPase C-terminal domain-containing protein, partial [Mycobacterium sp.]|nr:cation transporting ATPase C-terminal domain-containing protein [Mycobacterium sp.]